SLIAVQVVNSLEKEIGTKIPISALFENPTIESLAQLIEFKKNNKDNNYPLKASTNSIYSTQEPDILIAPTTNSQKEILVECMLGNEDSNKSYNLALCEHLKGELYRYVMESALQELINRHQSLRCTFSKDGNEIYVHKDRKLEYTFADISDSPSADQRRYLDDHAVEKAETVFDIINGPLFNASIIKIGPKDHFLTLNFHHVICDGFSMEILMKELSAIYNAFV